MRGGKMFNGKVENIQLTRQLSDCVAVTMAEVWIAEDKNHSFIQVTMQFCKPLRSVHQVNMFLVSNSFIPL